MKYKSLSNTVKIDTNTEPSMIIQNLKNQGAIDVNIKKIRVVDFKGGDSSSVAYLKIKSASFFHPLTRLFTSQKNRAKQADRICSHLQAVWGKNNVPTWLLKNVRDQIETTGGLSGDFLGRNLEAFLNDRQLIKAPTNDENNMRASRSDAAAEKIQSNNDTAGVSLTEKR